MEPGTHVVSAPAATAPVPSPVPHLSRSVRIDARARNSVPDTDRHRLSPLAVG
ncbi:hypothetical protein [Streptomyces sp. ISL-11]|uniref:hypothetical protein n=1 Tax=Streptomyces sp. ISL-11 TaxID=2819174 RepID=UPI001BE7BF27|nr:hypothetical protein [Streptomyces sp. ISL-11]MBT2387704.1 hypothetical protein [Streptomyces sp. ISL-11]